MKPLLNGIYLPFTISSLRPACLAFILNDIIINERKVILEFGAGISTIMIGRLIKMNRLQSKVLSVEHNDKWIDILNGIVRNEQLDDIVTIIHAPLTPCDFSVNSNHWYDSMVIKSNIRDRQFDMVLIDGPPAFEASKKEARYPALPFIYDNLAERSIIYLDDANREGERSIMAKWSEEYSLSFKIAAGSMAYFSRGENFNAHLT